MRRSSWAPSIVPDDSDQIVYVVLDDFDPKGALIAKPMSSGPTLRQSLWACSGGQYNDPVWIIGFNAAEGWSKDVSADVAHEVRYRCDLQMRDVPFYLESFVERYEGRFHDVQLPLPIRLV